MYLSVVCLQKSNNVYDVILGEEILKKRFIFEIKLSGNELCDVSLTPERTFADTCRLPV